MQHDLTTSFVSRLRARDPSAWFELWETFGPVLRATLSRWGRGYIGHETVQDLSQETLAALAQAIDRHDPSRGARFSTWLLAIARYTLGDELDRRSALKRGGGVRPASLDVDPGKADDLARPDEAYEQAVFDAKIEAALRMVERESDFMEFSVYRMRVLEGKSGKEVALALGVSEPTVSRRLAGVRARLMTHLREVFLRYSFTDEEIGELERNGLALDPTKLVDPKQKADPAREDGARFDEAVANLYHRICMRRSTEAAGQQG